MKTVHVLELLVAIGTYTTIYLIILSPFMLLAALTHRLARVLVVLVEERTVDTREQDAGPLRVGFRLFIGAMARLSPPWYAVLLLLVGVFLIHAFAYPGEVGLMYHLHWLALHLAVEIALILATLSGLFVMVAHIKEPLRITMATAAWVTGWWVALWLCTPPFLFDAAQRYDWERGYTHAPLFPLVLPAVAGLLFLWGLHRAGGMLLRRIRAGA